eukprot:g797.t1
MSSSSSVKKTSTCLSPTKKDSLKNDESSIVSSKQRQSYKKRRTSEHESVQIKENEVSEFALEVKLLSDQATIPVRKTGSAAGYDISSAYDYVVPSRGRILIETDLAVAIPPGCYGRLAPRSGLALEHGIAVGAGVIDGDYRGSLGVLLLNHSDTDFEVKKGDRIAQLVLQKVMTPKVEVVEELSETERGNKGFGSTGVATDCTNTHDD